MFVIHAQLESTLSTILDDLGLNDVPVRLLACPRPDLGDIAVGAALQGAKILKRPPLAIAADLAVRLAGVSGVAKAEVSPPGYVNVTFDDDTIVHALEAQVAHPNGGITPVDAPQTILIDFGGPNIKPMHVGHLRSLVIGEALRRILGAVGHTVVSDIHLGDWGLPSGMILMEVKRRFPDAPWFVPGAAGPFPAEPPITTEDLATLYPDASAACKADEGRMAEARAATAALQAGTPGLSALWRSIVVVAKAKILAVCDRLGAHFDLTLGESDAQPEVPSLIARLEGAGFARRDWGMSSGMILMEVKRRIPDAPWFVPGAAGSFPAEPPITVGELAMVFPDVSDACKADEGRMAEARAATAALNAGDPGLSALWQSILTAKAKIQGESGPLDVLAEGIGHPQWGGAALVMDVARPDDKHEVPPLVLEKEDGSALYATTDLATLVTRRRDLKADRVLYVVDGRQGLHFLQVFRAAEKAGIAPADALEHIGFGTVNDKTNKPFKTRSGSVMGLEELLDLAKQTAMERLVVGGRMADSTPAAIEAAADHIGIAALKIADLSTNRVSGYTLDLERATSVEGKTGPYLLYALVRLRSILAKAGRAPGPITLGVPAERRLAVACLGFGAAVQRAAANRSPLDLVAWAFDLAGETSRFYAECPVAGEADDTVRASRVALCLAAEEALARALDLLGCRVPEAM